MFFASWSVLLERLRIPRIMQLYTALMTLAQEKRRELLRGGVTMLRHDQK